MTDRAVVVLRTSPFGPTKPRQVAARLPRSTTLGPLRGPWGRTEINGQRHWIHNHFRDDVVAADAGPSRPPQPPS